MPNINRANATNVTISNILAWLGKATLLVELLKGQNVAVPGVVTDAITLLNTIAKSFNGATPPNNLQDLLDELVPVLQAAEALTHGSIGGGTFQDVIEAIQWTSTGIADVLQGQFATVATTHISYEGKEIQVALLACRMDGGEAAYDVGFTEALIPLTPAAQSVEPPAVTTPVTPPIVPPQSETEVKPETPPEGAPHTGTEGS